MRKLQSLTLSLGLLMAAPGTVWAQAPVSASDLTRLEATATEIRERVNVLRTTDATLATEVEGSLEELADEITYLRVKLRREGTVTRDEYASVRDRLETLRIRAQGRTVSAQPVLSESDGAAGVVPVGAMIDIRLQTPLNSGTATVEQRFEATTVLDYAEGGRVLIPAGSLVRGFVSSVRAAGRIDRRGSLTLSFDEIRIDTRTYRLRASVTQAIDGKMNEDVARIGAGAVVGAILGGIIGGGKGALLGVLVGGGGTIAATEGADVDLPAGTILRLRRDQPLELAGPS
jgi:hypothetical protein